MKIWEFVFPAKLVSYLICEFKKNHKSVPVGIMIRTLLIAFLSANSSCSRFYIFIILFFLFHDFLKFA